MNLSCVASQRDIAQHRHGTEALGDIPHVQKRWLIAPVGGIRIGSCLHPLRFLQSTDEFAILRKHAIRYVASS
jgi:hypothetical protein